MHEYALVRSLLAQVEKLVTEQGGGAVDEIRLECGPLSGVEPALMLSAFDLLPKPYSLRQSTLVVESIPLEVRCRECGVVFQTELCRLRCPACDSGNTDVIRGEGIVLDRVVLFEPWEVTL